MIKLIILLSLSWSNKTSLLSDTLLIASIIKHESSFRCNVTSNRGAIGLMQLKESTAKFIAQKYGLEFRKEKLIDPVYNITLGASYFKYLENKFYNKHLALIAYNWGETHLSNALRNGSEVPDSVKKYATNILKYHEDLLNASNV